MLLWILHMELIAASAQHEEPAGLYGFGHNILGHSEELI